MISSLVSHNPAEHFNEAAQLLLEACAQPSAGALFGVEPVVEIWTDIHNAMMEKGEGLGLAEFIRICALCQHNLLELRSRGVPLSHTRLSEAATPLWNLLEGLCFKAILTLTLT